MFVNYKLNTGLKESEGMFPKTVFKMSPRIVRKAFVSTGGCLSKFGQEISIYPFLGFKFNKMLLLVGLCKISVILGGFTNFKLLL